ncbi:MAG: type II secretion system protein [Massilia sp.]|nr:type II secretion system protein [Massilia sp.]
MTLIELVVALVIMGVALAGVVAVYASTTRASVDPVIVQQMQAIADNMMEEILLKPYAPGPAPGAGGARVNFDDVRDYNGYGLAIQGIRDVEGNAIPGLERYTVLVAVTRTALTNIPDTDALQIVVTVSVNGSATDTSLPNPIVLTGWRTNPS